MTTNRSFPLLVIGILLLLTACQAAGQPLNSAMLKSGDTVDGMSLGKGAAEAPPLWAFCSASQADSHFKTFDCHTPLLPTLAIGHIFLLTDETLRTLKWSELDWGLSIDGRAVDLESFGTIDYAIPNLSKSPSPIREVFSKVTAWNIVLTNLNPGEHTLRFAAQNETDHYTWLAHLVIEPSNGTDISSVPFPLKS